MNKAIHKAITAAGGQTALARLIPYRGDTLTPQAVQRWAKAGKAPPEHFPAIVSAARGVVTIDDLYADHVGPKQ